MAAGDGLALFKELQDEQKKLARLARIEALQDRVYDHAAGVVEATLAFHEVTPDQEDPPPAWIEEYGEAGARERLRIAKAGWMPPSLAPAAVKLAVQVMAGIDRGRGHRTKIHARELNVQIQLPPPVSGQEPLRPPEYPTKRLE